MRIIAGEHRGRKILSPEGDSTRPVTDRVKQALFDRLWAAGKLDNAIVLDLFAGTGSMGLECLSRGAEHVTFVERDRSAVALLKKNIEMLKVGDRAAVLASDALSAALFHVLANRPLTLVFVDPPYAMTEEEQDAKKVAEQIARLAAKCAPGAYLILRTAAETVVPRVEGWRDPLAWNYGSMTLHAYEKAAV